MADSGHFPFKHRADPPARPVPQHKTGADAASHRDHGALGVKLGPTLRVSFDHSTTTSHVEMFLQALREAVRM
jgi:selenocysteine lyase/cysteine desulfurase